jgi:hypothetical protein
VSFSVFILFLQKLAFQRSKCQFYFLLFLSAFLLFNFSDEKKTETKKAEPHPEPSFQAGL